MKLLGLVFLSVSSSSSSLTFYLVLRSAFYVSSIILFIKFLCNCYVSSCFKSFFYFFELVFCFEIDFYGNPRYLFKNFSCVLAVTVDFDLCVFALTGIIRKSVYPLKSLVLIVGVPTQKSRVGV